MKKKSNKADKPALHAAMGLLARREHSAFELCNKLKTRGFAEEEITEVVKELEGKGYQSDKRFTEAYLEMRKKRGFGSIRIRQELKEKGISSELIETAFSADIDSWVSLANSVRVKRFGDGEPKEFKERMRQAQFLQYRGFTSEQIKRAIKNYED